MFHAIANATDVPVSTLRPSATWVADGLVRSVARFGRYTLVGGEFERWGRRSGGLVAVRTSDGRALPNAFAFLGGKVHTVVADGHGGWYAGGLFLVGDATTAETLVRLRRDGSVDPTFAPPRLAATATSDAQVFQAVVVGDTVVIRGEFRSVNGAPRGGVAALDRSGAVTSFAPTLDPSRTMFIGNASWIAAIGDTVYLAGSFSAVNGVAREGFAAVHLDGEVLPAQIQGVQLGLVASAGQLITLVGGAVEIVDPSGRVLPWAARVSADAAGGVESFAADADRIYELRHTVTGYAVFAFSRRTGRLAWRRPEREPGGELVAGARSVYIANWPLNLRLDAATGTPSRGQPHPVGTIETVVADGPRELIAGELRGINSVSRPHLVALDVRGRPTGWRPRPDYSVEVIAVLGPRVLVGGAFDWIGDVPRSGLASFDRHLALTALHLRQRSMVDSILPLGASAIVTGSIVLGRDVATDAVVIDPSSGWRLATWSPTRKGAFELGRLVVADGRLWTVDGRRVRETSWWTGEPIPGGASWTLPWEGAEVHAAGQLLIASGSRRGWGKRASFVVYDTRRRRPVRWSPPTSARYGGFGISEGLVWALRGGAESGGCYAQYGECLQSLSVDVWSVAHPGRVLATRTFTSLDILGGIVVSGGSGFLTTAWWSTNQSSYAILLRLP
jgi:hypothetical protein